MFDYSTLVDQVRRLLGDNKEFTFEESTLQNTSYYITLANEGSIDIEEGGIIIDDEQISSDEYVINGNIIKFNERVESGSIVSIEYTYSKYSDSDILKYIGDTIFNYISGLTNTDYLFGKNGMTETKTNFNVTHNEISLFVHGTVLNMVGINILDVAGDAIYIRDGDTTIRTDVSSKEAASAYKNILSRFLYLLKTVRTNTFQGVVIGD